MIAQQNQISWVNKNKRYVQYNYSAVPGNVDTLYSLLATVNFPQVRPSDAYLLTGMYLCQSAIRPNAGAVRMLDAVNVNVNGVILNGIPASITGSGSFSDSIARIQLSQGTASVQNINIPLTESVLCDIIAVSVGGFTALDTVNCQILFEFEFLPPRENIIG